MPRLQGTVAVITGAGRGIGRAIAQAFALEGAHLALCARTRREVDDTAAIIRESTRGAAQIHVDRCDVASDADVTDFARRVATRFGCPQVVVNNAAIVARGRLDEQDPREWREVIEVDLFGPYRVARAFLPAMRQAHMGRILNISSISGRQGTANLTAYCTAKHGLVGMTRALAKELRDDNIQVNAICPGSVDTEMLKGSGFEPQMSPEDIARVALFLAADAPPALTGACLDVFG